MKNNTVKYADFEKHLQNYFNPNPVPSCLKKSASQGEWPSLGDFIFSCINLGLHVDIGKILKETAQG